jgi:hypothetical protein
LEGSCNKERTETGSKGCGLDAFAPAGEENLATLAPSPVRRAHVRCQATLEPRPGSSDEIHAIAQGSGAGYGQDDASLPIEPHDVAARPVISAYDQRQFPA